jgi:hypothetical protein
MPAACDVPQAGPSTPLVYLHVKAEQHIVVERSTAPGWCALCTAPCDGYVPASGVYRMTIDDRATTTEFSMPNQSRVTLTVDDDGRIQTKLPPPRLMWPPMQPMSR